MPAPRGDKWETDIERKIKVLEQLIRKPLSGSGMSIPAPGTVQVTGNLDVSGNLNVSGHAAITGTLSLPAGIIGNDALAEPLRVARLHDDAASFAVSPGAGATILSASVPVPVGFSQAIVLNLAAAVTAINSTASTDYLYIYGAVNSTAVGWQIGSPDVPAGASGVAYDLSSQHLTGLTGGSLTVTGTVSTGFAAWAASASNVANLDAAVLFLR